MKRMSAAIALALFLTACQNDAVPRPEWQEMSQSDKVLAVRAMMGNRQSANSKGGTPVPRYSRSVEEYVAEIDAKYALGDARPANEIWNELAADRLDRGR